MTITEIIIRAAVCIFAVAALLCYATLWAEARNDDPEPPEPETDLVDFDEERL